MTKEEWNNLKEGDRIIQKYGLGEAYVITNIRKIGIPGTHLNTDEVVASRTLRCLNPEEWTVYKKQQAEIQLPQILLLGEHRLQISKQEGNTFVYVCMNSCCDSYMNPTKIEVNATDLRKIHNGNGLTLTPVYK